MYFLQTVDDETYAVLKSVHLKDQNEKSNAALFCGIYKEAIYGDESIALKSEVLDCKQKDCEDIAEFSYRLTEKANIAYDDPDVKDENCLLAFVRGVKSAYIRRKLNESTLTEFNQAVKLAKRLEKIEKMDDDKPEINSILKETEVCFQHSRGRERRDSNSGWQSHSYTD